MPTPNIPLVKLTNQTQPVSALAKAGQFANLIQRNAPKLVSRSDNASTVSGQFKYPNGSFAPANAGAGRRGEFGAMLPAKVRAAPRQAMRIQGSTGRSESGLLDNLGNAASNMIGNVRETLVSAGLLQGRMGAQGGGALFSPRNPAYGGSYNPTVPSARVNQANQLPASRGMSTAALTGANNARYVYQGLYRPDMDEVYRRNITQLTAPYQGSLAAITGANMVEPANTGFPGTDPRQQYPVSNQYLTGQQGLPNMFENVYGAANAPSGGGYGGGYGRRPGSGYGGYSGGGSYTPTAYGSIMNWRVATG